jgi:hypothetical protein
MKRSSLQPRLPDFHTNNFEAVPWDYHENFIHAAR